MNGLDRRLDEHMFTFYRDCRNEVKMSMDLHSSIKSSHEAYAVTLEELDEFWDEVKRVRHNKELMRLELMHIAAMACRASIDLGIEEECAVK